MSRSGGKDEGASELDDAPGARESWGGSGACVDVAAPIDMDGASGAEEEEDEEEEEEEEAVDVEVSEEEAVERRGAFMSWL